MKEIFKTIECGTGLKTSNDFLVTIAKGGFGITPWARDLLMQPVFAKSLVTKKTKVKLYVFSTAELINKPGDVTIEKIFFNIEGLGFKKCSNEIGPQLRLQYKDQPNDDWLVIYMDPIKVVRMEPRKQSIRGGVKVESKGLFCVGHSPRGLYLSAVCGSPKHLCHHQVRWVVW